MQNKNFDFPLIILAAGASLRMGEPKGLLPVKGKTWLELQLETFMALWGGEALVVLGFQAEDYLKKLPWLKLSRKGWKSYGSGFVQTVLNSKPELGQFSSLQVGIRALHRSGPPRPAFIMPVDMLPPDQEVWFKLGQGWQPKINVCKPVYRKKGGHPLLISSELQNKLLTLPPDDKKARLDLQINQLPQDSIKNIFVQDNKVLSNFNTKDEFLKLLSEGL